MFKKNDTIARGQSLTRTKTESSNLKEPRAHTKSRNLSTSDSFRTQINQNEENVSNRVPDPEEGAKLGHGFGDLDTKTRFENRPFLPQAPQILRPQ